MKAKYLNRRTLLLPQQIFILFFKFISFLCEAKIGLCSGPAQRLAYYLPIKYELFQGMLGGF